MLAERRAGSIIILHGSLLGLVVPVIHMKGASGVVGGAIGKSIQAVFLVGTLLALGVNAMFSAIPFRLPTPAAPRGVAGDAGPRACEPGAKRSPTLRFWPGCSGTRV